MRDLLVHCPDALPSPALRYAAGLARMLDTPLSGLKVCEPFIPLEGTALPAASGMVAAWAQDCLAQARDDAPAFARWAAQAGLSNARWLVAQGALPEIVAQLANWHDVLVVERNDHLAWGTVNALGQLLLSEGLPLLVLPEKHAAPASLQRVVVAWNGAPESTRALHAALPLLRRASTVLLLRGQRHAPFSPAGIQPAFDPADYLAAHGIAVSHYLLDQPQAQDGAELLEAALDQQADLLVMGGYGRSRFAEWMLGGATRHVLRHTRVPVLMRH